ncbi:MAG: hypothetical protein QG650_832 [Patescibacteria group bacterium]|nr:hypothetical protein [Patescibacteria group bacterium]
MMRNERNAQRNNLISLAVPVAVAVVVLVIIIRALFSGSNGDESKRNGADSVRVVPKMENSEIYIYMSGDSKKQISAEEKMFPTDNRLEVKSGDAELIIEGSPSKVYADRLTEVSYRGKSADGLHSFELQSAYLWVEAGADDTAFKLKSFSVKPKSGSVVALSQNAVGSNVYVLKGLAEVTTETSNATVGVNQMVTVLSNEAKTVKLPEAIKPIDSFFRTENVYVKHDGDKYLMVTSGEESSMSGGVMIPGSPSSAKAIVITSPEDEASFDTATVDIEGKITNPAVIKITVGDREAKIDAENKSFSFKEYPLPENANNLVYKAFDKEGSLLVKGVLTVYSSAKKSQTQEANKPTVTTYPISDKDFRIVAPTENPYKTTENVVRIEGRLPKGAVKYITINGFRLSKFSQFGTYWYYFANKDYGTMNDGINTYEIKYYGENDEVVKTSQFIIVKDTPKPAEEAAVPAATTPTEAATSGSAATSENKPL